MCIESLEDTERLFYLGLFDLLHVGLLGDLEVPDGLADIVQKDGGARVGKGPSLDVAADSTLCEGHATGIITSPNVNVADQ